MNKALSIGLFAVCLNFSTTLGFAGTMFKATLNGAQEVPVGNASTATGFAKLELNDAQTRLEIMLEIVGLDLDGLQTPMNPLDDVVAMHLHRAPFGVNGPVVFGFRSPNNDLNNDLIINAVAGTVSTAWDVNEGNNTTLTDELPNLFSGGLYFNVHTPAFPGGEIRGQVRGVPEPSALTAWCLLVGLGGVSFAKRQRRKKEFEGPTTEWVT